MNYSERNYNVLCYEFVLSKTETTHARMSSSYTIIRMNEKNRTEENIILLDIGTYTN